MAKDSNSIHGWIKDTVVAIYGIVYQNALLVYDLSNNTSSSHPYCK